jgi:CBS domain-containing protein
MLFHRLPVHWMWWPAVGGLLVGIGGLAEPRVLGPGYEVIEALLRGDILGRAALGLLVAKAVVWSVGLGSGTSGGLLVPLLLLGGAFGALPAHLLPVGNPGLWVSVGMAAMVGSAMRLPLTATVLLVEMTHDVNLFPAVLAGSLGAHAVGVFVLRRSLVSDKVASRGCHVTYEYGVDPLAAIRVGDVMDTDPPAVVATMTAGELAELVARHDPLVVRHQATPVVAEDGRLVGIVTRADLLRALGHEGGKDWSVLDAGTRELVVAYPEERLHTAANRMLASQVGRLVVVDPADPGRLIGYLGRRTILEARAGQHREEHVRERMLDLRGWARRRVPTPPLAVPPVPGRRSRTRYRDV